MKTISQLMARGLGGKGSGAQGITADQRRNRNLRP